MKTETFSSWSLGSVLALVVTCEHASRAVPEALDLGLRPEVLDSHVAWDPGARGIAAAVAERSRVPLLAGQYSRLVVDLNRGPSHPGVVPAVAFGVPIPGNQALDEVGRHERLRRYHAPYWKEARTAVATAAARGPVLHLSVHTFSADFGDAPRPWDFGVLYEKDSGFEGAAARTLLQRLDGGGTLAAPNVPYGGAEDYLVTNLRRDFAPATYAGILLEVSQRKLDSLSEVIDRVLAAVAATREEVSP